MKWGIAIAAGVIVLGGYIAQQQLERALPLPLRNIIAIQGGAGELGILASGHASGPVSIGKGIAIPARTGTQPLVANPLPKLPMPDHPHLMDELASGGVHGDSYNSRVLTS